MEKLKAQRTVPFDIVVLCVPLLFYWLTLAPDIFAGDSVELTTGAYSLGIIHPPGYPTYLLLGHLFIHLPVGPSPGYRMNLMSAVWATLTAWVAYRIILKFVVLEWHAMLGALLGALSFYIWGEANVAEVYSLHWLFVLLSWLFLLNWAIRGREGWLYLFAFTAGLSLTHHTSVMLVFPGYAVLLFCNGHKRPQSVRQILVAAALFLIGLAPYLALPLRYLNEPELDYARKYLGANLTNPDELIWFISGGPFQSLVWASSVGKWSSETWLFLKYVLYNYLGVGCLFGLAGIMGLFRKDRSFLVATLVGFAATALFYINYDVFDKYTMYGVCLWLIAIWIGVGLEQVSEWGVHPPGAITLALLLLILQIAIFYPQSDMSQSHRVRQEGTEMVATLPQNAVYLGTWSKVMVLEYLQIVERQRPDVLALNLPFISPDQGKFYSQALRGSSRVLCFSAYLAQEAKKAGARVTSVLGEHCYQLEWTFDVTPPDEMRPAVNR